MLQITQQITAFNGLTAPSRSQPDATFVQNADAHVAAQRTLQEQLNTFASQVNIVASEVNSVADLAATASGSVATIAADAQAAIDAAARAAASEAIAVDSATIASGKVNEVTMIAASAQNAVATAVSVVTGGTAALIPTPGKIPLANASGKIDLGWIDPMPAISAALPSLPFVDVCVSLAKDDSDGRMWGKRFADKPWGTQSRTTGRYLGSYATALTAVNGQTAAVGDYYYNTTTSQFEAVSAITGAPPAATAATSAATVRMGSQEFSADNMVTVEAGRPIIWDIAHGTPTPWAVLPNIFGTIKAVAMLNGLLCIGSTTGLWTYDFNTCEFCNRTTSGLQRYAKSSCTALGTAGALFAGVGIGNNTVNDVAITVLPDAPIDGVTGMPAQTVALATEGGVSVVKQDGSVIHITESTASYSTSKAVAFDAQGRLHMTLGATSSLNWYYIFASIPSASDVMTHGNYKIGSVQNADFFTSLERSYPSDVAPAVTALNVYSQSFIPCLVPGAFASTIGLARCVSSISIPGRSLHGFVTSTYMSGWQIGATKRVIGYDTMPTLGDRSAKVSTGVVEVGVLTKTVTAGSRTALSGFSNANYIQEPSHADWNALAAGEISVVIPGVKWGAAGTLKTLLSIGDGVSSGSLEVQQLANNTLSLLIHNGTALTAVATSTATFTDSTEHVLEFKRGTLGAVSNMVQILIDGIVVASAVSALSISNATGFLRIGEAQAASRPWVGGQFSGHIRLSATAPTAEQSRFIADTENALNGGQPCLLSNSSAVSALAYNKDRDLLLVGNGTNVDTFAGLKRIASQAHGVTTLKALAAGTGATVIAGTGASVSLEERNIRGELNNMRQTVAARNMQSIPRMITSDSASVLRIPQGFKPVRVTSAGGTYISLSANAPKFDGFLWYLDTGVAASTNYDCELIRG
ncbi:MAG: hypothetical protein PHH47_09960 [Gallionella sp.]|nr:hypothetical protein [Gallionella sp.]MDD4947210.1 hypothetical protein [Gallionella sp.]